MNFKQRYLAGEIEFEEIDEYIMNWNFSDTTETLAMYLGLNEEEEDVFISVSEEALEEMLAKQKK